MVDHAYGSAGGSTIGYSPLSAFRNSTMSALSWSDTLGADPLEHGRDIRVVDAAAGHQRHGLFGNVAQLPSWK